MNERIKLLAEQAEQYALDKANEGNDEDYDYSFDDDFQQKFAELIVRECADIGQRYADGNYEVPNQILEHFGVEE
jgi:hypothetical protein